MTGNLISGTSTQYGPFNFTVRATDSTGKTADKGYGFAIPDPVHVLSPSSPPHGSINVPYSQLFTVSGGTAPYSFEVEVNVFDGLPPGLSMSSSGLISGTPTVLGTYQFSVLTDDATTISNSGGNFKGRFTLTMTIDALPPAPVASSFTASTVSYNSGSASAAAISVAGHVSNSPSSYAVGSATTANGGSVSINASGQASYTPPVGFRGNDSFTFTATNGGGTSSPATVTVPVASPTITVTPATLPSGTGGVAYSHTLAASGGLAPYAFSTTLASGALPAGLSIGSGGVISGTPTATGTFNFTVTGADSSTGTGPATFTSSTLSLTIAAPAISVMPPSLTTPVIATAYTPQVFTANGGTGPYAFSISSGALPAGMSLTGDTLSGTPTEAGSFSFSVQATDNQGFTGSQPYSFTLAAPSIVVGPSSLPGGISGTAYAPQTVTATGGTAPYSYGISGGALPPGLDIDPVTGIISGTPTTSDSYSFSVRVSDSTTGIGAPFSVLQNYTIVTTPVAPTAGPVSATVAYDSSANAITLALGGGAAMSVAVATPAGHGTATATGTGITYTPAAGYFGDDSFTYTATNLTGTSLPATVTITVTPQAPTAAAVAATLAYGSADNVIALDLGGGTATLVNVASAAAHGMATATGTSITYTPAIGYSGGDSFTYTASNAGGVSAPATVTITITAPVFGFSPMAGALTPGAANVAYAGAAIVASGGIAPYSYAVTSGALPAGLSLNADGTWSGTPSAAGPFSFTVTATDSAGTPHTGSAAYTLDIAAVPAVVLSPATGTALPAGTANLAYPGTTISATGGVGAISFSATGLPVGLAIDATTGVISGTPAAIGPASVTVTATAATSGSASATYTLNVTAAPVAVFEPAAGTKLKAMAQEHYSEKFSVPGGLSYTSTGTLPAGLGPVSPDGKLEGTLAEGAEGSYSFTVTASTASGPVSATYQLDVVANAVTTTDKVVKIMPGATPLPVDLTAGATGGEFTAAILGTVTPPQAGTAEITMGDVASIDSVWSRKFYLKFHPNPAYSGTVLVGYTLVGAGGSSTGTVTFIASLDPDAVAKSFDRLVKDFVQTRASLLANSIETPGLRQRRSMSAGTSPGVINVSPSDSSVTMNFASSLAQLRSWGEAGDAAGALAQAGPEDLPFNFWIDGTATLHLRTDDGDDHWGKFALVSVGGDYLVNDTLLVGVALHADFMDDRTDATTIEGQGILVGPYISAEIVDGVFLDASVYYGRSWNDVTTSIFGGSFETERLLAKASLEGEWALSEALTLRPKANAFYLRESAGQYTVSDGLGSSITIAGFTLDQLRLSAGGTLEYRMDLGEGLTVIPYLGAQFGLSLTTDKAAGAFTTLSTGFDLLGLGNVTLGGAIQADLESNSLKAISAKANIRAGF